MPKISVIIPAYNDERYISRCLDSFICQTFSDMEIIVVDDGSTDSTPNILEDYCKKDSRIKIITQRNQKQGAARNNALKIASSDFIMFADSDDWVDLDYCEKAYNTIIKYDADIALTSAVRIKNNGKFKTYYDFKEEIFCDNFQDIIKIAKVPGYWQVWGKLFKKSLLDGIFCEEEVFYEDPEYLIKVLHKAKSLITVANSKYYYFSNPNSTIKSKHTIAKIQNQISSMEKVFAYAKTHSLELPPLQITKKKCLLSRVKIYTDRKEYYLFGIKFFTKNEPYNCEKVFLVFNTAFFGDVLLCNPLCQNIKAIYPDSKVVFVVNKPFYDAAKYQDCVDDVIIYDKKSKHKGFLGLLRFVREFKYKNIFASFITYKNLRNSLIAKLLGSQYVINPNENAQDISMQKRHCNMLSILTSKSIANFPMRCNISGDIFDELKKRLNLPDNYIVICAISKNPPKDMPIDTAIDLIKLINNTEYKPVLVGAGALSEKYAADLDSAGASYINTVGKTTIYELANVIKNAKCLVSVDTGTMHLGCAIQTPTIAVFYEQITLKPWSPNPEIYNSVIINKEQTPQNIFNAVKTKLI